MDRARDCVVEQLEAIRRKLLDLTNRNRLLNFKYRAGSVRIVDEQPVQVFDYLVKQGKEMVFLPLPEEAADEDGEEPRLFVATDGVPSEVGGSLPDAEAADGEVSVKREEGSLQTKLEAQLLETRLRRIRSDARSFIQETGNNHLFLAMGFLHWTERADSTASHDAPLILIPVEVVQQKLGRKAQRCTYKMQHTGEDLVPNLSLREKLRKDYGLNLPILDEGNATGGEADEEFDLVAYFDTIANAVADMPGWEVRQEMVVDFFTFAKLQMYLDLDPAAWPKSCIADHDVIQQLLGCAERLGGSDAGTRADQNPEGDSLPIVLDADSSQLKAIHQGLGRGNMVIQGPPGTGKSQTITNLIACLLAEGKSVLFVAEKMAALEVVHRNLEKVGLSTFCLELHSHKTDKKRVINSLKTAYEERGRLRKTRLIDTSREVDRLRRTRNSLGEYIELLQKPVGPGDETVFKIFGKAEISRQRLPEIIPLRIENIDSLTHDQIESAQDLIQQLSRLLCELGRPAESPWYGYEPVDLIGGDQDSVAEDIQTVLTTALRMVDQVHALFAAAQVPLCAVVLTYGQVRAICSLDLDGIPENVLADIAEAVLADTRREQEWEDIEVWRDIIHKYHHQMAESSRFLNQPDRLPDADLEQLSQLAKEIQSCGLASLDLATAMKLRDAGKRLCVLLDQFQKVIEVPVSAGLPGPRTVGEMAGFARLESLIRNRPEEMSGPAHENLLMPSLRVVFTRMLEEGQRLTRMRQELARIFILKDVCPPDDLAAIRRILRGTQGTLRKVLSSEYRQSKRKLQSFLRQPSQAAHIAMADRLDVLESFLTEEPAFSRDQRYIETFAGLFEGLQTDWERITSVVAWVTDVCDLCDSPALAKAMIGLEVNGRQDWPPEGQVLRRTHEIAAEVRSYSDIVSKPHGADSGVITEAEPIGVLRDRLSRQVSALTSLEPFLVQDVLNSSVGLADILTAIKSRIEARGLQSAIETDPSLKSLAGQHFNGVCTEIDAIADTINWTLRIRDSGLPVECARKICAADRHDLLAALPHCAEGWADDLVGIATNLQNLARFGLLDVPRFLGSSLTDISLAGLVARMCRAGSAIGNLVHWADYCRAARHARGSGLAGLLQLMEDGELAPTAAVDAYLHAVYDGFARKVVRGHPQLATFTSAEYELKRQTFAELDAQLLGWHRQEIAYKASLRSTPSGTWGSRVSDLREMYLLQNEFHKERRHLPIRQLMNRAGNAVRSLTPVLMMSPLSVAQFLEPGAHSFDVVIMDEASQIEPPDALGAIARAERMIIVGDSKQLPPTNFFDKAMGNPEDDEDEMVFNDFDASESILTKCEQVQFPSQPLLWHYRSEHESLIAFSNARWYDNRLIIFPSSGLSTTRLGVLYHYLEDAVYTPGRNVNEIEGECVARAIVEHARKSPELSLGVGTFNLRQRILIEDILARLKAEDLSAGLALARLDEAHEGTEPLFIKNLENLQGDERDVIFVSCTFGPDRDGRVYQRFGPLAYENGWRRLNVLITRAKKRVEVFTSMRPEDITGVAGQEGRIALRAYLEYARTGRLPDREAAPRPPDSDFELAVAQAVRNLGYEVQCQVGVAGYFVDIGVRNPIRPEEYVLGIECDGATYHSSVHARDRDRLREEVLRKRGWEIHRIWSTDWFKNREPELARLKRRLAELVRKSTPIVVQVPETESPQRTTTLVMKPHLSDDELRTRIRIYCRENISRSEEAQAIDGFLHPIVLDALVTRRITNRSDFREYIPVEIRANTNNDDLQHLDDIFEIIEQAS